MSARTRYWGGINPKRRSHRRHIAKLRLLGITPSFRTKTENVVHSLILEAASLVLSAGIVTSLLLPDLNSLGERMVWGGLACYVFAIYLICREIGRQRREQAGVTR